METHSTDEISNLVEEGFDILLRTGELEDSNMVARKLLSTRFMTCASPEYIDRYGIPSHPAELANHDCCRYLFPTTRRPFDWPFIIDGQRTSVSVSGRHLFTNANAMIASVVAGGGLIHLQDYMLRDMVRQGQLVPVLEKYSCDGGPVSAVYLRHFHQAPKIRAFIGFYLEKLSATL